MNARTLSLMLFATISLSALAQNGPPPPPPRNLTVAQRNCLESLLGRPDPSKRPNPAVVNAAFQKCGLVVPPVRRQEVEDSAEAVR